MKNIIYIFLLLIISSSLNAQWQTDIRMTNAPDTSKTSLINARCLAASGNLIHIVWYDTRDGNYEIYYKRSIDGGQSWGSDIRLTTNEFTSYNPAIALSGSIIHVVWYDNRDGNYQLFYKRSFDNGATWEAERNISSSIGRSGHPSITVSGSDVHLVWWDNRDANFEIYYMKSIDNGNTYSAETRLTNNAGESVMPGVAISGNYVHVSWYDSTDGNWEIYYKRSADGGLTWGNNIRLTNNSAQSRFPSIAASGAYVHIAFFDNRNGVDQVFYKRSTNNGTSWASDVKMMKSNYYAAYPSLAVSGSDVHVLWNQYYTNGYDIQYSKSVNNGGKWSNDSRVTNADGYSSVVSAAVSGSNLHIIWRDTRDGNNEIYYKLNGQYQTGKPLEISNINSEIPNKYSLSQNYPNPFNPVTKINFELPKDIDIRLTVYDVLGREVYSINEFRKSGSNMITFDGTDLASGVYYYSFEVRQAGSLTGTFVETKKMVLIK